MVQKIVRAAAIIIREGKILLALSKYGNDSFYLCPGGVVEEYETIREAAQREIKEETNCDVRIEELLYVREWINKKEAANVLDVFFRGKFIRGKETHLFDPCLAKGVIKKLEWVPISELQTVDFEPKMLVSHLQNDYPKDFEGRTIYIGASP